MSFKIIKKAPRYFEHVYNGGSKATDVSDFEAILESVAQTFSVQCKNGSNIPSVPVPVLDIIVIDETDASTEETFLNIADLRTRLTELQYIPYISPTGIEEAPIDGSQYARKNGGWVVVTGGGSTPSQEQVLLVGDRPTELIIEGDYVFVDEDRALYLIAISIGTVTLDAGVFADDSEINYRNGSGGDIVLTAGAGVTFFANDSDGDSNPITIPDGYLAILKKFGSSESWYVNLFPSKTVEQIVAENTLGLKPIKITDRDGVYFTDLASARTARATFITETPVQDLFLNGQYFMWFTSAEVGTIVVSNAVNEFGNSNNVSIEDESGFISEMQGKVFKDSTTTNKIILSDVVFSGDQVFSAMAVTEDVILGKCEFNGTEAFKDIVITTGAKVSIKKVLTTGADFALNITGRMDLGDADSGVDFSDAFITPNIAWVHLPYSTKGGSQSTAIGDNLASANPNNGIIYD